MIVRLEAPAPAGPTDLRRALRRTLDLLSARSEGLDVVPAGERGSVAAEAVLTVRDAALAVLPGGLRAAVDALGPEVAAVVPGGFFPGSARAQEPYAALWEMEATVREAPPVASPVPDVSDAPVVLSREGRSGGTLAAARWLVHSFAGRRAHARPELAALLPAGTRRVLEIGCAEGALGAALGAAGAIVVGVEPDPDAARVAADRLAAVHPTTLEEALPRLDGTFDLVVAADVLEHLADPVTALARLAPHLTADARLLVSLPNGSHASVLAGIVQGRWDQTLEGIVADDHRTYAGRAGWTRLLAAAGWRVDSWEPIRFVPPGTEAWLDVLGAAGLGIDDLAAVQWLGLARRGAPLAPLELGPSEGADPLDGIDPVGVLRAGTLAAGPVTVEVPNALAGDVCAPLFLGEVVSGPSRAILNAGWGEHALVARFRGSAVALALEVASCRSVPAPLRRVLDAARAAGLPLRRDLFAAAGYRATFRPA